MNDKIQARAVVRLTVEIPLHQPWAGDAKIASIYDAAANEAITKMRKATEGMGARIIGLVEVDAVLVPLNTP